MFLCVDFEKYRKLKRIPYNVAIPFKRGSPYLINFETINSKKAFTFSTFYTNSQFVVPLLTLPSQPTGI